jgi:cytochrome c553
MMRISAGIAVASIAGAIFSATATADSGRNLAAACANCHGTNGHSQGGTASLAGQNKARMLAQLRAFRDGKRAATIMHQIARGYSDAQFELLSDYFSRQPVARSGQ